MASAIELISSTTLSSSTPSVTIGSGGTIPQNFIDLILIISGKSTRSDDDRGGGIRFNSDSGNNYSYNRIYGTGGSAISDISSNSSSIGPIVFSRSSNFDALSIVQIFNYSNSNIYKTCLISSDAPSSFTQKTVSLWRSTSAITSIQIFVGLDSIAASTSISLYGIKA